MTGQKLKLLSLFAGIGGFELGLERSGGFETVAQCEIDPYCQKVLAKHWPQVKRYADIRDLTAAGLAADGIAVDAICGGFPCQDVSYAGKGAGIEGHRSGLWSEFARLIGELRPQVVFVENTTGLLSRGMGRVLADLAALGFDAEWHVISSAQFGAPHDRKRVWLVAYPESRGKRQLRWFGSAAESAAARHLHWPEDAPPRQRVADGVPDRVDRLKALGNAVVPQIPELLGRAWLEATQS